MKNIKKYSFVLIVLAIGIVLGAFFSSDTNYAESTANKHLAHSSTVKTWTCSMDPQVRSDTPGNCPICGMELIPLIEDTTGSTDSISQNEIVFTAEAIQLANIQTDVVVKASATKTIHLLGKVQPDERRLYSQVAHIPGRIERLYVNFTGEKVKKGQKIARMYSPDLITAQKELFESIRSKSVYPELYKATRNKLKQWKLTDAQIDAIEKSGKVQEQIDILSDYSGYVMKRNVELGSHVKEGSSLYDIADLSSVWVLFEAYESDIPWIQTDNLVTFTVSAIPGKIFNGRVSYVDPFISSATRVVKVRVEIKNPATKLLPDMYVSGVIQARLSGVKEAVIVPKSAVLWTGKRAVVYVKKPQEERSTFAYREIVLGADMGNFYAVKKGLKAGEIIATNGVFRIDASAQLLGKQSMMNFKSE